jgi:hypothetical protein
MEYLRAADGERALRERHRLADVPLLVDDHEHTGRKEHEAHYESGERAVDQPDMTGHGRLATISSLSPTPRRSWSRAAQ